MVAALPSISVITICRNAAQCIEGALASVAASAFPGLEYVVVDGASTDGTLGVIERFRDRIDILISEPDRGISDALNKGIMRSRGEFHLLLHADDRLLPGALEALGSEAVEDVAVVAGTVRVVSGDRVVRLYRPQPAKLLEKMSLPHIGCLTRKSAWAAVGGYDLRRKIAMDHLLMLKIWRQFGARAFRTTDAVVAEYSMGGSSDAYVQHGFREVRDNLVEAGVGRLNAEWARYRLRAKSALRRVMPRRPRPR